MKLWLTLALALPLLAQTAGRPCSACHSQAAVELKTHLTCEGCHGKSARHRDSRGTIPPDRVIARENAPSSCGTCHGGELRSYLTSQHAKIALGSSKVDAPTCTTCHGAHRLRTARQIEQECQRCHLDSPVAFMSSPPPAEGKISCMHCHSPHSSE